MGKTPLILAPIIVGGALLWLSWWLGMRWERVSKRYFGSFIDPKNHSDLVELVRQMLTPTSLEEPAYLPEKIRERAVKLIADSDERDDRRRREELRRRY